MINRRKWHLSLLAGLVFLLAGISCGQPMPPASPAIAASPSSFSFSAYQGGADPASQVLSLWNSGGGTLSWSVGDDAPWLILTPTSGSSDGEIDNITLSVDISGMDAGSYDAGITVSAPEANNTPQIIPVNLAVKLPEEEQEIIDALDTEKLLDIGYDHPQAVVTVEGVVVGTYYAQKSKGKPTFLDFHDPYEGYCKCVIWEEDRETHESIRGKFVKAFPPNPETHFLNRRVKVKGTIGIYKGVPEIVLHDPSQIWIVE